MWGRSLYLRCQLRRGDVNNGRLAAINISIRRRWGAAGTKSAALAGDLVPLRATLNANVSSLLMLIAANLPLLSITATNQALIYNFSPIIC